MSQSHLVEIQQLKFFRGDRCIYDDINIMIPKGKITAVMGPSGIGKTTLLKLIGGQLAPDSGTVLFDGKDVHSASKRQLYEMRNRMGMLFQSGALFSDMSVFENIAFPLREHTQLPESMIRRIVLMKLEAVGLRGAHTMMSSALSGGMQRRVALARAIVLDPEMLMLDEPFTGQDPISMAVLVKLISELTQALHLTSIIVSHDVPEVLSIADYAYVLAGKKVIGQGTPQELMASTDPELTQFLAGHADGPVPFHMQAPSYKKELFE
tara:strand:+ start:11131 stop:11928 length:798 start_codon:yes stop_codon:yes gene_type:complete